MRGRTSHIKISLSKEQREILESLLRRQKTPVGLAKRARAMLLLAEGERFNQTSERVGLGEGQSSGFSPSSRVVSGQDSV